MGIIVSLSSEELAEIKQLTQVDSDSEAVTRAAREFLRVCQLRQLKSVSGHVDYEDNWRHLESLELGQTGFPR